MLIIKVQKIINFPVILATVLTLLFGSFCVGLLHSTSSTINSDKSAITSKISEESCCGGTMTISHHIYSWINTFLTTPEYLRSNSILTILGFLLSILFIKYLFSNTQKLLKSLITELFYKLCSIFFIFDSLQFAFARGILNTKLY